MLNLGTTFNQKFKVISNLGHGLTADVYKIECNNTKKCYALKVIKKSYLAGKLSRPMEVKREMRIAKMLDHKNFIHTCDSGENGFTDDGKQFLIYQIMEYIPNDQVFDLIKECGNVGEDGGRLFLKQMVEGIEYMHEEKGVVHRDIKMENMLISRDLTIKFADFGFATNQSIDRLLSYRGTKTYMAPEIKLGQIYKGKEVDIFSIGVILFIMV